MVTIRRKRTAEEKARLEELSVSGVASTFAVRPETKESPAALRVQMASKPPPSAYSGTYPGGTPSALRVQKVEDPPLAYPGGTPSALRVQRMAEPRSTQAPLQPDPPAPKIPTQTVPTEPQVLAKNGPMTARVRPATPEDLQPDPSAAGHVPSMAEEIREALAQVQPTSEPQVSPIVDLGVVMGVRSVRGLGTLQALLLSTAWPRNVASMGEMPDGEWPGVQVQRLPMAPTPWARFVYAAHMLATEYVLIIDDDAVPAPGWIEAAIRHVEKNPKDIVSVSGMNPWADAPELGIVGPGNEPSEVTEVLVGKQGWLLKRDNLGVILSKIGEKPEDLGWDVHLSKTTEGNVVVLPYTKMTAGTTQAPVKDEHSLSSTEGYAERWGEFLARYSAEG